MRKQNTTARTLFNYPGQFFTANLTQHRTRSVWTGHFDSFTSIQTLTARAVVICQGSALDANRSTRHHGLVDRVYRDRNRITSPHRKPLSLDKHGRQISFKVSLLQAGMLPLATFITLLNPICCYFPPGHICLRSSKQIHFLVMSFVFIKMMLVLLIRAASCLMF